MSKDKDKPTETDEEAPKGKKKLFLIVGVVVLALAGAAYFFLFSGGEAEAAPPEHGGYTALEPIAVNLALALARRRGVDPDSPPGLRKVTPTR